MNDISKEVNTEIEEFTKKKKNDFDDVDFDIMEDEEDVTPKKSSLKSRSRGVVK